MLNFILWNQKKNLVVYALPEGSKNSAPFVRQPVSWILRTGVLPFSDFCMKLGFNKKVAELFYL